MRAFIAVLVTAVLAGCAGNLKYVRPTAYEKIEISKTIPKPRDTVWNSAVLQLGKQFFVIDHLDKASGFINLSYNGDPGLSLIADILPHTLRTLVKRESTTFQGKCTSELRSHRRE